MNLEVAGSTMTSRDDDARDGGIPETPEAFLNWDLSKVDLTNLDYWIPTKMAMMLLNLSERQIQRDAAEGILEKRVRPMPGSKRRGLPVYNPRDIQQRMRDSIRPAFITSVAAPVSAQSPEFITALAERIPGFVERLADTMRLFQPPPEPPLFMDLRTACVVAGIREDLRPTFERLLRNAIQKGDLKAWKRGKVYFLHRDALFNFKPSGDEGDDTSAESSERTIEPA